MAEVPLIVIGRAARGHQLDAHVVEQSDLYLACFGSHGDAPRVVLAPPTSKSAFIRPSKQSTLRGSINVPVIVLSDQAIATRIEAS
jgi:2-oxoglutarate ferredoxin oxidoreductase subunit alpha